METKVTKNPAVGGKALRDGLGAESNAQTKRIWKREKEKKGTKECLVRRKRGHIAEGNDYFLLLTTVVIMKDLWRHKKEFLCRTGLFW